MSRENAGAHHPPLVLAHCREARVQTERNSFACIVKTQWWKEEGIRRLCHSGNAMVAAAITRLLFTSFLSLFSLTSVADCSKYKIVLVRHGESTWNAENRFTGW